MKRAKISGRYHGFKHRSIPANDGAAVISCPSFNKTPNKIRNILLILLIFFSCTPPHVRKQVYYADRGRILKIAESCVGASYRNGGQSPNGFDCSGLVLYVYKENGILLPRKASEQFYSGKEISLNNAQAGDLVFFQISNLRISHVGIYAGDNKFIHAPGEGKEVSYASIKNSYWKRRFIGAVSLLR